MIDSLSLSSLIRADPDKFPSSKSKDDVSRFASAADQSRQGGSVKESSSSFRDVTGNLIVVC